MFERLAGDLSAKERSQMLDKLKSNDLTIENIELDSVDINKKTKEEVYQLTFIEKIIVWLFTVFMQKKKDDVVADIALRHCCKSLVENKIITENKTALRHIFEDELYLLSRALMTLRTPISIVESKNKGAFYSLIFEIKYPEEYQDLLELTDPSMVVFENDLDTSDIELIRAKIISDFEEWLDNLDKQITTDMQVYAEQFFKLSKLTFFEYNKFLKLFRSYQGENMANIASSKPFLNELGSIIASFTETPSEIILKALYIFTVENSADDADIEELGPWLDNVKNVFNILKNLVKKVEYISLLKFANKNPDFKIEAIEYEADWLSIFIDYWKDSIKKIIKEYSSKAELEHTLISFRNFFGSDIVKLEFYRKDRGEDIEDDFPAYYEYSLAALIMIYRYILNNILHDLKILMDEGEFYRQDNILELEASYKILVSIDQAIKDYEYSVSPKGKVAHILANSKDEKKIFEVLNSLNRNITKSVRSYLKAINSVSNVLLGVLQKSDGIVYDGISNQAKVAGGANIKYFDKLEEHQEWLATVHKITTTIFEQEKLLSK